MRRLSLCLLLLPLSAFALSDQEIAAYLDAESFDSRASIPYIEDVLKQAKKESAEGRGGKEYLASLRENIKSVQQRLALIKKGEESVVHAIRFEKMQTGEVGTLSTPLWLSSFVSYKFSIRQVASPTAALMDVSKRFRGQEVASSLVWVSGISTKDIVDGTDITSTQMFRVEGTKTYTTVLGASKTVFEICPLSDADTQRVNAARTERLAPPPPKQKEPVVVAPREPEKSEDEKKAEWESKWKNATTYKLNDGTEIKAQRDNALAEKYLIQDFDGKWHTVMKADVKEIVKPETER